MPKTEADWRSLDARIARGVMGWVKWDDLPTIARMNYLAILPRKPDPFRLARLRKCWWSVKGGCVCVELFIFDDWEPHKDLAQAMQAKDKIVMQEWCFDLSNRPGSLPVVYFWRFLNPMVGIQGHAETDARAICLAVEAWLAAQKEKQDDQD